MQVSSIQIICCQLLLVTVYHNTRIVKCTKHDILLLYKGLRPGLPENAHPQLLDLMRRCWEGIPSNRPPFSDILAELEDLLARVQVFPLA